MHGLLASSDEALHEYDVALTGWDDLPVADAIILAFAHQQYLDTSLSGYQQKLPKSYSYGNCSQVIALRCRGIRS